MSTYEDLISILFTLPDNRSLEDYYKTNALVGKITTEDLASGVEFPKCGVKKYGSYDEVIKDFKPESQFAVEAKATFDQKNNSQTKSQIKYLMIIQQNADGSVNGAKVGEAKVSTNEAITEALNRAKAYDGKFVKVVPISREKSDIEAVAGWCLTNKRFTDFVVKNVEDVKTLVAGKNDYAYGIFRKNANEPIASAVASTSTCGYFGASDGSAQFTQLVNILPETYSTQEVSDMKNSNIAYYTNVAPIDGGQTDSFGYNWVIGSKMLGGQLRQRQMIMDYVDKGLGLAILEFFNNKPKYDETGNNSLLDYANKFMRSCQTYNLIIETNNEQVGYELQVIPIRTGKNSIMNTDVDAYNAKKYKLVGYYYDAIVGEKVNVNLYVDPTEKQIEEILGKAE